MDCYKMEVITGALMRLDNEAQTFENDLEEYHLRVCAIDCILTEIKKDFGFKVMQDVIILTCQKLGRTLKPLKHTLIRELIDAGWEVTNISKVIVYKNK